MKVKDFFKVYNQENNLLIYTVEMCFMCDKYEDTEMCPSYWMGCENCLPHYKKINSRKLMYKGRTKDVPLFYADKKIININITTDYGRLKREATHTVEITIKE